MKKLFYILLVFPLGFMACVNNSDQPTPPPEFLPVTVENLVGRWETFYSEKGVINNAGNSVGYRVMEYDGFITTYFANNTFQDENAYGDVVIRGTFSILKNDTIEYRYRTSLGNDTITKQNVSGLSNQFLSIFKNYVRVLGDNVYSVKDIRVFRNLPKAAGLHPNVDKVDVTLSKLVGSWELYDYYYYVNGSLDRDISDQNREKYKGTVYTFAENGTARSYLPNGQLDITGSVRIVDDVVYIFSNEFDPETNERISFYVWISDWREIIDPNNSANRILSFIDFDQFRNRDNINQIIRTTAYFKKIN